MKPARSYRSCGPFLAPQRRCPGPPRERVPRTPREEPGPWEAVATSRACKWWPDRCSWCKCGSTRAAKCHTSKITCSTCAHLLLGRLLLVSHQFLTSFKTSLKSSASPYRGRMRLTLRKRLDMPNPFPPAEKLFNPKLSSEVSHYTACIWPGSFLGTCRNVLCVSRCLNLPKTLCRWAQIPTGAGSISQLKYLGKKQVSARSDLWQGCVFTSIGLKGKRVMLGRAGGRVVVQF